MNHQWFHGFLRASRFLRALAFTLLASAVCASGATLIVSTTGLDNATCGTNPVSACRTIQYTIANRAVAGDVIRIEPGTYHEILIIAKNLTLIGSAKLDTIVDAQNVDGHGIGTVVTNGATTRIWGLVLKGGYRSTSMVNNIAGGVDNAGELILEQSVVTDSTAVSSFPNPFGTAGGILNSGTLALIHSLVEDNSASGGCVTAGGIVNIVNGKLLTEESVVRDNAATGSSSGSCGGPSSVPAAGGIVNNQSLLVASTTTIDENAITNNGTMLLDRSTVSNTTISDLNVLYAVNSTLYQAPISIEYLPSFFVGVVHINSSTVYSTAMPGVNLPPLPTSTISDSILAGYPGGDCTGDFTSGGYNLIEHSVGCTVLVPDHDLLNIAAGLGSFGGHGGPTRTINLVPGSPALGGGNPAGCKGPGGIILTEDQRGDPRPAPGVGVCDIGSVQD